MGRIFLITLEGKIYSCKHCQTHIALREDIISKAFHCRHGKAYLLNKIANFTVGETEERLMMTGVHSVCDIFCVGCGSIVGWKYVAAQEKSQRYKEGKFILERFQVLGPEGTLYYFNNNLEASGSEADDM